MSNKDPSVFIFIFMNSLFLLDFRRSVMTVKSHQVFRRAMMGQEVNRRSMMTVKKSNVFRRAVIRRDVIKRDVISRSVMTVKMSTGVKPNRD